VRTDTVFQSGSMGKQFTATGVMLLAGEGKLSLDDPVERFLGPVPESWRRDAIDLGPMAAGSGGPFELAFLDPPYRQDLVPRALAALRDGGWLTPNAVILCETGEDETIPVVESFHLERERIYGDTRILFYTKP